MGYKMDLKTLIAKLQEFELEYGNLEIIMDYDYDSESNDYLMDVTEAKNVDREVVALCLSNYVMEDNNWGE